MRKQVMSESQTKHTFKYIKHTDKDSRGIRFKARAHRNRIYDYRKTKKRKLTPWRRTRNAVRNIR